MSERMTVEEARQDFVVKSALWEERMQGSPGAVEAAFDRLKQAILDEGLKEYQARVDGLVEAAAYYIDRLEGVLARRVVRDLDESRAGWEVALAAVRESQVSQ